jgi:hypothetical protein
MPKQCFFGSRKISSGCEELRHGGHSAKAVSTGKTYALHRFEMLFEFCVVSAWPNVNKGPRGMNRIGD